MKSENVQQLLFLDRGEFAAYFQSFVREDLYCLN